MFLAALAVRLHWNLHVHPLGDYIYSDMNGYVQRADRLLKEPFEPHEYSAFFPFGTHWLVAAIKLLAGPERYDVLGVVYALMGAATAAMAYASARLASRFRVVPPLVGIVAIFYYPQLSLSGYILSEPPFAFFLGAALLSALRLAEHGKHRDAWLLGLFAGVGAWFRPQILLSAAFVGLYWIARRKDLPKIRFVHLAQSAIPLALALGLSATHLHFNTGRLGLVSENGTFNLVFGRCHNGKIESLPDGKGHGHVHFRPPPFLQVGHAEERARKEGREPAIRLDGVVGDVLSYKGYIGDKEQHWEYIRECVAKTGWWGQVKYSWTNVLLVWRYTIPWPDSGRALWRGPARWWTHYHKVLLAIPALLALGFMFAPGQRSARMGLVAVNLLALLVLAAVIFGGPRHRSPYDFIILLMALEVYALAVWYLGLGIKLFMDRQAALVLARGSTSKSEPET